MEFGFCFGTMLRADPDASRLWELLARVERTGYDSAWLYNTNGALPPVLDLLTEAVARTERLVVGPHVLVAAGMPPLPLAERLSGLAAASGGRFVAQLGLGGPREALIPDPREAAKAMEGLLTDMAAHFDADDSRPRPPVWLGGHSPRAARRVAALADGWVPSFIAPAEFGARRAMIDGLVAERGGRKEVTHAVQVVYVPPELDGQDWLTEQLDDEVRRHKPGFATADIYAFGGYGAVVERVAEFRDQGAAHVILVPARPPADPAEEITRLYEEVVRTFR
ncbi:LLM class flavin-dependent oxidoreductase [Actinokineospora sp. PR83]|uniref:LLM class flavin-dependent oxidoreductase n=1 Tax=Actinokineospora sp. PR83 TaxID=2884908 RepID=UPI001F3746C2|nr:LLM class flavin-dependent oxidoreductase [Actinokineospora sp. PR83]MCG8920720.1 LLM class flavin-dependent oxidoreductase [Actinokineospora sp. PR83]